MKGTLRFVVAAVLLLGSLASVQAKQGLRKYWIEFRDKGITPSEFRPGTPIFEGTARSISARALERRAANLHTSNAAWLVTLEDAPVCENYLAVLRSFGIQIDRVSKWENAASAELSTAQFVNLKRLPFVRSIHPVLGSDAASVETPATSVFHELPLRAESAVTVQDCSFDSVIYHYGYSDWELRSINVLPLHAMGFTGKGVMYGILDDGFNWREMRTTKNHRVHAEYDFVFNDSVTANEANDVWNQDAHGSLVLSTATGYLPDSIIGAAYDPDLLLAKTEDVRSETPREEDNYAAALEWMEARGVEIASSSLGYRDFDSGFVSYNYSDLDGKTAISTRAALRAARLGVLVCSASGNGGQSMVPTLMAPSDADSILACGALRFDDTIASFSSNGPSADGRIKPDISAPGLFVATILRDDSLGFESGTSLATPLVSSACVLIKQTHPEATAMDIRNAVLFSAHQPVDGLPDNVYGYGEIDAYNAALRLGTIIGTPRLSHIDSIYSVCVAIAANNSILSADVRFEIDTETAYTRSFPLQLAADSLIYNGSFGSLRPGSRVRFFIEAKDGADTITRSPRRASQEVYSFTIGDTNTNAPLGVPIEAPPAGVRVYPNPAADHVTIQSMTDESVRCELVDAVGRVVTDFVIAAGEHTTRVNLGSLPNGSYQLRTLSTSGIVRSQTIVISR